MSVRDLKPIAGPELGVLEFWLDHTTDALTNTAIVRRLMATLRQAERRVRDAEAEADAAWSLLTADLRDKTSPPPTPGA